MFLETNFLYKQLNLFSSSFEKTTTSTPKLFALFIIEAFLLLVPIKTTSTSEDLEKKEQIFIAFDPFPEPKIAIFIKKSNFYQKYNKQRNVKIENKKVCKFFN